MDARLLEILVCPLCKGPLKRLPATRPVEGTEPESELICNADRLAFPVRDGIPVMLVDEARKVPLDTSGDPPKAGHTPLVEPPDDSGAASD